MNYQTLEFKLHTANDLQAILEDRVEQAFQPGAVQPTVVETIADEVAGGRW